MNKEIKNNYVDAFAGVQISDLISGVNDTVQLQASEVPKKKGREKSQTVSKDSKEPYVASEDERRAVEKAQNAHRRGRGRKKSNRVPIRFEAEQDLVAAVEELHFRLVKTKNELYNEALALLVSKYVNM